ncbi:hypothetical protein D9615_003053 [Tricholomella constricta]|uniref:Reverse transcriptase domain-containing protein n=1 Tax=Tricholomella constricta TaxID=117010 RepID=A0A8H5HG18_9AGAR|nr:hypothetical protein D9615_003053 [Tricholomella constricta]
MPLLLTSLSIRIGAWNLHGNLALKLIQNDVSTLVRNCDIYLFVETWLRPGQHDVLTVPDGFHIYSSPRPAYSDLRPQRGGVAALVHSSIPVELRESLCAPDIIGLELPFCLMLGVYIPPPGSNWQAWSDTDPEDKLFAYIEMAHQLTSKPLLILGDINARTGSRQVDLPASPRRSSSDVVSNARGNRLLDVCRNYSLVILNGTTYEHHSPGAYTSLQPGGSSVVDYALLSRQLLPNLPGVALTISQSDWSDHAQLLLHITYAAPLSPSPCLSNPLPARHALLRLGQPADSHHEVDDLHCALQRALDSVKTVEDATALMYGSASVDGPPVLAYVATTCRPLPDAPPAAAFGIYYGPKNRQNVGFRITGSQTDARASVAAILCILHHSSPTTTLCIYTSSQNTIRTIVYGASRCKAQGWECPNGDLYSLVVDFLVARAAPVTFRWVPSSSTVQHLREARILALAHCNRSPTEIPFLPPPPPSLQPSSVEHVALSLIPHVPKVSTSLPLVSPLPPLEHLSFDVLHIDFDDNSHRGRKKERDAKMLNLRHLKACQTPRQFWNLIREWTDPKPRPPQVITSTCQAHIITYTARQVTAQQLYHIFRGRLNPSQTPSTTFDPDAYATARVFNDIIPSITADRTVHAFFSRPFSASELQRAKRKLAKHPPRSACGADGVSYTTIGLIPNETLLPLLQTCIDTRRTPGPWLYTVLVGILKRRGRPQNPKDYRLIGLESCMLKLLTLLIDERLREWAESANVLPDSQNGFRPKYRTNNNSFILRCAIERARASGKDLYIAFVDLENAFPSTDLSILWTKLYSAGVSGPLFDWLRSVYADMTYIVRHGGDLSDTFTSLLGLLTGDTASPGLWNIFFSDLSIPDHADDVLLNHRPVSHIEQADDVAVFTTSPHGLQCKMDAFQRWCSLNRMIISTVKTKWSVARHGPTNSDGIRITVAGIPIEFVTYYTYVGITFDFANSSMFQKHSKTKTSAAQGISGATFTIDSFVGIIPPPEGRKLYMARIDPHLIHGCDVILDTNRAALNELENVQRTFIRRMLHLSARSLLHPLYTETGLMPLKYRRIILAVGFLNSIYSLAPHCLAYAALMDSINLAQTHPHDRTSSWVKDLIKVCAQLPDPVHVNADTLTTTAPLLSHLIESSARTSLQALWDNSTKLVFRARGHDITRRRMQPYLKIPDPKHRHALTRLLLSDHPLAVEQLRRRRFARGRIERHNRLCRFCRLAIEDEVHALFGCRSNDRLLSARDQFLDTLFHHNPRLRVLFLSAPATQFVDFLVNHTDTLKPFAAYVHKIFGIYDEVPMCIPTT